MHSLYLFKGYVLFIGIVKDNKQHQHPFIQLTLGLTGKFEIRSGEQEYGLQDTALIHMNHPHQVDSGSNLCGILLIDLQLQIAKQMRSLLFKDSPLIFKPYRNLEAQINAIHTFIQQPVKGRKAYRLVTEILERLTPTERSTVVEYEKVNEVLGLLANLSPERIGLKELSRTVGLSESRLAHTFKEQMGLPVRRYILWIRLQNAARKIITGVSFTEAAHDAGFSDAAHLSRTFRMMFGQTMLDIFKKSVSQASPAIFIDLDETT